MRIEREVVLPAAPAEVWEAVTDEGRMGQWLGGEVDLDVAVDVAPGGSGIVTGPGEPLWHMRVHTVEPGRRLGFEWWPDDGSGPLTEVELELTALDDGTLVRVVETFVAPPPLLPRDQDRPRRLGFELRARVPVSV